MNTKYNLNSTHPLITNSQEYMFEQKMVSIHSEDRDINKYPLSSDFEIELPQDYCNVQSIKLNSWTFPISYYNFSKIFNNITLTFKITNPYNPGVFDPLYPVYLALYANRLNEYVIEIEEGNYTSTQLATELTNLFNQAVTNYLISQSILTPYDQFVILFNPVSSKLWFGNKSSEFELTNNSSTNTNINASVCINELPSASNYGLPYYLGFLKKSIISTSYVDPNYPIMNSSTSSITGGTGWLTPTLGNTNVFIIIAPNVLNLFSFTFYSYMEIHGHNSIDETSPYSKTQFTKTTNETNGIVNSSFAKIPMYTNTGTPPNNIYYTLHTADNAVKIYNPPATRIRKLKIKLRYHNGLLVDFNGLNYSFTLEFLIFRPQSAKQYNMYKPESY
jgi:hypothetical protein